MSLDEHIQRELDAWLEVDLSAAAIKDELRTAYAVDEYLRQIKDAIDAGRHPVLVGEAGVGKTAIVHELARRLSAGDGPTNMRGKRFVQLSLEKRARMLEKKPELNHHMKQLVDFLCGNGTVVPFFRDFDKAYQLDLEAHIHDLAVRLKLPVLGEGSETTLNSIFSYMPELQEQYVLVHVSEPDLEGTRTIVARWSDEQHERDGRQFTSEAQEEAVYLTERFLPAECRPRKSLDALKQTLVWADRDRPIGGSDVDACFAERHHLPRSLVDPTVPLKLDEIRATFRSRILGQPEAVEAAIRVISLIKSRLSDERRPFGVFLFVGPTGVGKTYLAKMVAEFAFGSADRLIRFNMADHQEPDAADILFGGGQVSQGLLEHRLTGRPLGVVLFDELEKAHPAVLDRFLQFMDEGCFITGSGRTISCRSLLLIATSNAGSHIYRHKPPGFTGVFDNKALDREIDRRLEEHFRFEFLNRFDQVVHFHPLDRQSIRTIARRELDNVQQRIGLKQRNFIIEVDEAVLDWLSVHGYDPDFGARFLHRTIERNVTTELAECIVQRHLPAGSQIALRVRGNRIVARPQEEHPQLQPLAVKLPTRDAKGERVQLLKPKALSEAVKDVMKRAKERLTALSDKKQRRSRILAAMNESDFWDGSATSRDKLDEYRDLDVAIQIEGRLAKVIERLGRLHEQSDDSAQHNERLAGCLEDAAQALHEWEQLAAEEGPSLLWMVINNADPLRSAGSWIEDLVKIETAWSRQLQLDARVVAYEVADDHVNRAALEIEGSGAATYLALEEGIHRLSRRERRDLRATIRIIPQSGREAESEVVASTRRRQGRFGLRVSFRGQLLFPERGISMDWRADDEKTLRQLLADLRDEFNARTVDQLDVVRIYAERGTGVRDLRTGAVIPRMKDVREGKLQKLLDAWHQPAEA